ncbi:hypothetical protein, partial [Bordetella hinzii]|uniref:hypothetical protein n=1 Tax=Bordetella hinzii TaxID=103855 RepID=UPI001B80733C
LAMAHPRKRFGQALSKALVERQGCQGSVGVIRLQAADECAALGIAVLAHRFADLGEPGPARR